MKETTMPFMGNSITSLILGALAVLLVAGVLTGRKIPLVGSDRTTLILLVIVGMAMCMRGIGRVSVEGAWAHPLAILGYLSGAVILVVAIMAWFGKPLPYVNDIRSAIIAISILSVAKVLLSAFHRLIS